MWLEVGDKKFKFFHNYASHRRNINTIYEIKNQEGSPARTFEEKSAAGVSFFQNIFKEPKGCPIQEILEVLGYFLRMVTEEMNQELIKEIYEEEIRYSIHSFLKGKSLGLDGFTVEFYIGFYDLIKKDILEVMRESQELGKVPGSLNSTFFTLIPKKQKLQSFDEFGPISCCNMIYKIISMVLALRIKIVLSEIIAEE